MKTILVTGPIGSGKSAVCRLLAARGVPVYDCDARTKSLYVRRKDLVPRLEERGGKRLLARRANSGFLYYIGLITR